MESQDKEKEYEKNVWEIYRKEWATASNEKRTELNKRMSRWQELMKSGLTVQQAYYKAMEEELVFGVAEEPSGKQVAIPPASRLRKAPLIFLSLALVASIVYCIVITTEKDALNTELESVKSVLASTQSDLTSTQADLSSTKQTLASTQADLDSTEAELSSTKQTLSSTQGKLDSTQADLGTTKQTLVSVQNKLDTTTVELEATEAELKLYKDTLGGEIFSGVQPPYTKAGLGLSGEYVDLTNSLVATNPTWSQLKAFLRADSTDDRNYSKFEFNCTDFSEMLHNRAENKGIKTAFVAVTFSDRDIGHALNAFKTTDKGLVYVDCTGPTLLEDLTEEFLVQFYGESYAIEWDKIAYVMKGKEYGAISINRATSPEYSFYNHIDKESLGVFKSGNIVESIKIYW